jgi:hypothetical protein
MSYITAVRTARRVWCGGMIKESICPAYVAEKQPRPPLVACLVSLLSGFVIYQYHIVFEVGFSSPCRILVDFGRFHRRTYGAYLAKIEYLY